MDASVIRMHACDYDGSAAHSAQWQELELILHRLLQHGNMRERRERVVYALLIPTERCALLGFISHTKIANLAKKRT